MICRCNQMDERMEPASKLRMKKYSEVCMCLMCNPLYIHHLRPFVPLVVVDRHVRCESSTSAAEKPTNCQQCHQGSYALLWVTDTATARLGRKHKTHRKVWVSQWFRRPSTNITKLCFSMWIHGWSSSWSSACTTQHSNTRCHKIDYKTLFEGEAWDRSVQSVWRFCFWSDLTTSV